jgi:hypothetical protein
MDNGLPRKGEAGSTIISDMGNCGLNLTPPPESKKNGLNRGKIHLLKALVHFLLPTGM